jgi:subtilisin family serine protease
MLVARRDSPARGICPEVRLLVRPIFTEAGAELTPADVLAEAIVDCINAGARLINISAAFTGVIPVRQDGLGQALAHAARRGVIVVAAAGNESRVGGSPLLSHPWVIPVTSTDLSGHPLANTNMGQSIGRHGLSAPGTGITSLSAGGGFCPFGGTSAAAPLVTGALALAWSAELATPAGAIRAAVGSTRRRSLVPPSLDARAIYQKVTGRQP